MRKLTDIKYKAVSGRIILSVALTLALVLTPGITPVPAYGAQGSDFIVTGGMSGTDYTYGADGVLTFTTSGAFTVSMANPGTPTATDKIVVNASGSSEANPVNIILDGVRIDVSGTTNACAFEVRSGSTAGLTLSGINELKSGQNTAGLHVPPGAAIIIGGDGTLTAYGGGGTMFNNEGGAGIGGSTREGGGAVTITDGTVTANGGQYSAGIGGGYYGSNGSVNISGGTVNAYGRNGSAGIGGGSRGAAGTIDISGGTVIAEGYNTGIGGGSDGGGGSTINISGGTVTARGISWGSGIGNGPYYTGTDTAITISGGTVNATASTHGAGIGGGFRGSGGTILITGGTVTAQGGKYGAGIGGGRYDSWADKPFGAYEITISGGTVNAAAGQGGAGIGGGFNGDVDAGGNTIDVSGGTINIIGGTVTATGGNAVSASVDGGPTDAGGGGAGIGGGCKGSGGNVYISGGSVKAVHGICTGTGTSAEDIGRGYTGAGDGILKNSDTAEGANVYRTALTLRDADNNLIADTPIPGTALDFGGTAAGYGKDALRTDAAGTLYFYLPANNASAGYSGKLYAATVGAVHTNAFTFAGFRTSTSVENISGYAGQTVTLASFVEDYASNPVNEGEIEFAVNGVIAGTASVSNGVAVLNWTIPSDWSVGSYPILAGYSGSVSFIAGSDTGILTVQERSSGGHHDDDRSAVPTQTYKVDISVNGTTSVSLPVIVNTGSSSAAVDVYNQRGNIFNGEETTVITMPFIPDVDSYTLGIAADYLSMPGSGGSLTFNTDAGSMTLRADMLAGAAEAESKKAEIMIEQGDKSNLSDSLKDAIGDRPLIRLALLLDGQQTEWNNPGAPVTVSIPYSPTSEELADPESIVIWYIDGSGSAVCVPNGRYDPAAGTVTFTATHFSGYAVVYNKVSFNDVPAGAWYGKAVSFIAARGITAGTGGGDFSPDAKLKRGDFLVLLMNACGIAPDTNLSDNFSDAGNTYYSGCLAAAKRLGITDGIGNDMFAPSREITRQEMFTMLHNALKVLGNLPEVNTGEPGLGNTEKSLSDFSDAGQIAIWATDAMALFVETETAAGSGGKLNPTGTTTRAEMAQVLYNLLSK